MSARYEKMAGPICVKFSGNVWSDHGMTWLHFGSIRVNGSEGQRSICLLSKLLPVELDISFALAWWQHFLSMAADKSVFCLRENFREGVEWRWGDLITPPPVGDGLLFLGDLFLSFSVSLSATLLENGWTNLHEIFREGVEWRFDYPAGRRVRGQFVYHRP